MWYILSILYLVAIIIGAYKIKVVAWEKGLSPWKHFFLSFFIAIGFGAIGFLIGVLMENVPIALGLCGIAILISFEIYIRIIGSRENVKKESEINVSEEYVVIDSPCTVFKLTTEHSEVIAELKVGDKFYIDNKIDWNLYYKVIMESKQTGYILKDSKIQKSVAK
jgi:hypothetical protein